MISIKLYGLVICIMQTSYYETFLKVLDFKRCNITIIHLYSIPKNAKLNYIVKIIKLVG